MLVLAGALIAAAAGVGAPAAVARQASPLLSVTCTSTVSYGDDMTCWAASTDSNGNFAEAGTVTFDKAHALGATWTASTCYVNDSQCQVDATLPAPPGAQPRTVAFVVGFRGNDGATVSTSVSVDLTLRPTVTTIDCASVDLALGGTTHCVLGVADQLYEWDSRPAQLGKTGPGLSVASSAPGDTVRYDKPAAGGSSCLPAVADNVLSCGFTLTADRVQGVRSLTATYPGDAGGRRETELCPPESGQRAAGGADPDLELPGHRPCPQSGGRLSRECRRARCGAGGPNRTGGPGPGLRPAGQVG